MNRLDSLKAKSLMLGERIKKLQDKKTKVDSRIERIDPDWNKEEKEKKIDEQIGKIESVRDFERDETVDEFVSSQGNDIEQQIEDDYIDKIIENDENGGE